MNKRGLWLCHLVALCLVVGVGCGDDPVCGDGVTSGRETCDDANDAGGDGCSDTCLQEVGWSCVGVECTGICGDGDVVADEVCDPNSNSSTYCAQDCSMTLGSCGDGVIQPGYEDCDSGTVTTFDGCNPSCGEDFGYTCSGTPSVCDASSVTPNATGSSLDAGQRSALCSWYISTLGGTGRQINCGALIYTVNPVSACASQVGGFLGSCTVEQFEQWVAERGTECQALESTVPIC